MGLPRTLSEAIYITLHKSKKDVQEISDELGLSSSLVYRWGAPEGTSSYADMPLRRLLSVMNTTDCDAILDYFERKRGRLAVKLPKAAISKLEENEMVESYQETTLTAVKALRSFLTNPGQETFKAIDDALRSVMTESSALDKYVTKKSSGQFEMEI